MSDRLIIFYYSVDDNTIWFDFDPLPVGTNLLIQKEIHCNTQPSCLDSTILIAEYPTISVDVPDAQHS